MDINIPEIQATDEKVIRMPAPSHPNEVNDIIGNPPSWLLRSGIGLIALVFTSILTVAYFIQYPDKINGLGTLTASSPPVELIARASGHIDSILVKNDSLVQQGDLILLMDNPTAIEDIRQLQKWINAYLKSSNNASLNKLKQPPKLQLGTMQNDYASLNSTFKEMQQSLSDYTVDDQINNLQNEMLKLQQLNESQQKEKNIYAQELSLTGKNYGRNRDLVKDGIVSQLDLEQVKMDLLQKERQYESMEKAIIQNQIRLEQLNIEILQLKQSRKDKIQQYQIALTERCAALSAQIKQWYQTYCIQAPIAGMLSYSSKTNTNAVMKMEQVIGHIIPQSSNQLYMSCLLPIANVGKIETQQQAIIKFDAYPYKEYGTLWAKVGSLSALPETAAENEQFYQVKIPLPKQLITDFGKPIPYKPNITAVVEIITEDRSILERIFEQLIDLINNN